MSKKSKKRNKKNKKRGKLIKVFVYGTLMVGHSLSEGLDEYRVSWERATTRGNLYHNWRWPMLVRSSSALDIVHGEVHEYPEEVLEILDNIEGYMPHNPEGSLYVREKVPVFSYTFSAKEPTMVWAYVWKRTTKSCCSVYNGSWSDSMAMNPNPEDD